MNGITIPDEVLTPKEVARILKIDEFTLGNWRTQGIGPSYFKLHESPRSAVRYRRSAVVAWIGSRPKFTTEVQHGRL